jgi:hypothetical protein
VLKSPDHAVYSTTQSKSESHFETGSNPDRPIWHLIPKPDLCLFSFAVYLYFAHDKIYGTMGDAAPGIKANQWIFKMWLRPCRWAIIVSDAIIYVFRHYSL